MLPQRFLEPGILVQQVPSYLGRGGVLIAPRASFTGTGTVTDVKTISLVPDQTITFEGATVHLELRSLKANDEEEVRTEVAGILQEALQESGVAALEGVTVLYVQGAYRIQLADPNFSISGPGSVLARCTACRS